MTIEVSSIVTSELSPEKAQNITTTVTNAFDTTLGSVSTDISYVSSGSIELEIPSVLDEETIIAAVVNSVSSVLNVHPSVVSVSSIDIESGIVEYEISSDTYFNATEIQSEISTKLTIDLLNEELTALLPSVSV